MQTVGVRELKNKLSEYLRRVRLGERGLVTDRAAVVAELLPPGQGQVDWARIVVSAACVSALGPEFVASSSCHKTSVKVHGRSRWRGRRCGCDGPTCCNRPADSIAIDAAGRQNHATLIPSPRHCLQAPAGADDWRSDSRINGRKCGAAPWIQFRSTAWSARR